MRIYIKPPRTISSAEQIRNKAEAPTDDALTSVGAFCGTNCGRQSPTVRKYHNYSRFRESKLAGPAEVIAAYGSGVRLFDRHGHLGDIILAVLSTVGWALQINGAERPCGFDLILFHIRHQRTDRCRYSFISAAVIDTQRR